MSARWMMRLYPRAWRVRYGAELEEILETQPTTPWLVVDVAFGAIDACLHPQLDPRPAAARGGRWLVPTAFRGRLTRGMLLKFAAFAGIVAALAGCGGSTASASAWTLSTSR